jgi:hypothetical protein
MSPPEVWGPAVWRLFHVLCEKLNENAFQSIGPSLFNMILRICKFLPCPDCASDASKFLANINFSDIKNKTDLKNVFYIFHNYVNTKKRKKLFNYSDIQIYTNYNLINVINNFIAHYHTKGNMKMLSESFQRQFVINDLKKWFSYAFRAFLPVPKLLLEPTIMIKEEVKEVVKEVVKKVVEEVSVLEDVPIVEDVPVVEEIVEENSIIEDVQVVEDVPVVEDILKEEIIKSKKGKKGKNKK